MMWLARRRRRGDSVLVFDSFDRANSAESLGTSDSGHAWTAGTGTWGISSNQAYEPGGTAGATATVLVGTTNHIVRVTLATMDAGAGLFARYLDANNWLRLQCDTNFIQLHSRIGGSVTDEGSWTPTLASGAVIELRALGDEITTLVNGEVVNAQTITGLAAGTRAGLSHSLGSASARWEDFSVRAG